MAPYRNALVLLLALAVTAVGLFEAAAGRNWDLAAVFALVAGLQLVVLAGLRIGRHPVGLRRDLATWLHEHAAATGEPAERVADRCVAAYRSGFSGHRLE